MFVLDTDHLVIAQHTSQPEAERLRQRTSEFDAADFNLTIVSVHEQLLGANSFISRAKSPAAVARGYRMIEMALLSYEKYKILPLDEPAAIRFNELRSQGVRIGTMDLRIAAIALSHGYTVLTRNTVDFGKVPGLKVEDWTVA